MLLSAARIPPVFWSPPGKSDHKNGPAGKNENVRPLCHRSLPPNKHSQIFHREHEKAVDDHPLLDRV